MEGVVGLTSWLAFLGLHVRRGLRTAPGLAAAILGYAVQAFFSISMPGVLPLVFVLAALCVKPQPLAARGWYRSLLGLVMAAPADTAAGGSLKALLLWQNKSE